MIDSLSEDARAVALEGLTGWHYDAVRDALHRHIVLTDFSATFALMTRIAMLAEQADHHPEWSNVYNRLDIWLTTHDADAGAGGVSARDVAMARAINVMLDGTPAPEPR